MQMINLKTFSTFCLLLGLAVVTGCGDSGDFPTAKVTGKVTCEGQPVAGAAVYFEPLRIGGDSGSALVGKQGFAFTEPDGSFTISTYQPGKGDGAVVGMHRVRVGPGDAKCNCSMNDEFDLMQVEVKADGKNEFELVLPKATAQDVARQKLQDQFDPPEDNE